LIFTNFKNLIFKFNIMTMTKSNYLKMAGYSEAEWMVMENETAKKFLSQKGSANWMYPIKDRKAIAELGEGFYLVKLSWLDKVMPEVAPVLAPDKIKEAVKTIDEVIPPSVVPPPPTIQVPPPPPSFPEPVILGAESTEEADKVKEQLRKAGLAPSAMDIDTGSDFWCEKLPDSCDTQCDECKDAEIKKIAQDKLKKVVEESGAPAENFIVAGVPKPVIEVVGDTTVEVPIIENKEETPVVPKNTLKEKTATLLENGFKLVAKTKRFTHDCGVFADKELISNMSIKEFEKALQDLIKTVDQKIAKEKANKPKQKIENVPTATEDVVQQFAFLDELVKTASLIKKTTYAITAIREALASTETAENKLLLIEGAVNNI
jgi:hypothetical protein